MAFLFTPVIPPLSSFCVPFLFFFFLAFFLTTLRNQEMSNMKRKIVIRIKKLLMWNFGCSVEEKINVMMAEERIVWHLMCAHTWKVRGKRLLEGPSPWPRVVVYCLWLKQHFFSVLLALKKMKFGRIKGGFLSIYLHKHLLIKGEKKKREQKSARALCD